MADLALDQELLRQLQHLAPEQRREVLDFAKALATRTPKGTPGRDLTRFAGAISLDDLDVISAEIEAGCEQVHSHEW
jgi:hypothetical protein